LAAQLAPDLVVSDLQFGYHNGIELAREVARTSPAVRVMILASYGPEVVVYHSLAAGAAGYVLKTETPAGGRSGHSERREGRGGASAGDLQASPARGGS
jgi:DNA-binding NarL/FixJ family response regulator